MLYDGILLIRSFGATVAASAEAFARYRVVSGSIPDKDPWLYLPFLRVVHSFCVVYLTRTYKRMSNQANKSDDICIINFV